MQTKKDFFLIVFLIFAVMFSAVYAAYSVHLTRKYVGELSDLNKVSDELQVEWEKLLLEINMLSAYNRIESIAIQKLNMQAPKKHQVKVVELN